VKFVLRREILRRERSQRTADRRKQKRLTSSKAYSELCHFGRIIRKGYVSLPYQSMNPYFHFILIKGENVYRENLWENPELTAIRVSHSAREFIIHTELSVVWSFTAGFGHRRTFRNWSLCLPALNEER